MADFTLTVAPNDFELIEINADRSIALENGAYQVEARTGNRLGLMLHYRNLVNERRRLVLAFISRLKGRRNRLVVPASILGYSRNGNGTAGTPLTNGAHVAGVTTVAVKGLGASETNVCEAGDLITFGAHFYIVTQNFSSDGAGNASVIIWPGLLADVAGGVGVKIDAPDSTFIATPDHSARLPFSPHVDSNFGMVSAFTWSLEQDVLA